MTIRPDISLAAASPCLLLDPHGRSADRLRREMEERLAARGGSLLTGTWREGLIRPFGGLLDLVAALVDRLADPHPEILRRYQVTLVNLLPAWQRTTSLRTPRALRAGLADYVLRGDLLGLRDFYWKRDVEPLVMADLVRFTLDAATVLAETEGAQPVLWLDGVQRADGLTRRTLELLGSYASGGPVQLVATARGSRDEVAPLRGWELVDLLSAGEEGPGGFSTGEQPVLQAAAVLVLPFTADGCARCLSEPLRARAPETVAALASEGLFRRLADDRFVLASPALGESLRAGLDPAARREIHERALDIEAGDPFAAAWHAREAGRSSPEIARRTLAALDQAWAVADPGSALALTEELLQAGGDPDIDGDVLLALIHFEAGRFAETDRLLQRARERRISQGEDATILTRLVGYNAIFWLGDLERGRKLLESVLEAYERQGRHRDAGFVRNSIAYALTRSGRAGEAVELEELSLTLAGALQGPDAGLSSVLQLNLGRLYRNLGSPDQALELFRQAMDDRKSEHSPYMILIFHISLAQLHTSRGEPAEALAAYHCCLELARDLKLENVSETVLGLLSRSFGRPLPPDLLIRSDEALFYFQLNLAAACRRAGLPKRAAAWLDGMRSIWPSLDAEVWKRTVEALDRVAPLAPPQTDRAASVEDQAERALGAARLRFAGLVGEVSGPAGDPAELARRAAAALAAGQVVAVARWRKVEPGIRIPDCLVLYDPHNTDAARRVNAEIGAQTLPAARSALVLPEEVDRFIGLAPLPLVLQEASLQPWKRSGLGALQPLRSRVQVLFPEHDGFLAALVRDLRQRTGVGIVAALPFHLRGRDLALTPEKALADFLISSADALVLGDHLFVKAHGAAADQNLLPFRPRLSEQASILRGSGADAGTFLVRVRIWTYHVCMRLRNETRPVLELCDGQASVAEILRRTSGPIAEGPDGPARVCGFLRELWHQGVICFEGPATA